MFWKQLVWRECTSICPLFQFTMAPGFDPQPLPLLTKRKTIKISQKKKHAGDGSRAGEVSTMLEQQLCQNHNARAMGLPIGLEHVGTISNVSQFQSCQKNRSSLRLLRYRVLGLQPCRVLYWWPLSNKHGDAKSWRHWKSMRVQCLVKNDPELMGDAVPTGCSWGWHSWSQPMVEWRFGL